MSTRCGRVCAICSLPTKQSESRHSVACGECRGIAQGDMPTACRPTADVGRSRDGRARGSKPFVF